MRRASSAVLLLLPGPSRPFLARPLLHTCALGRRRGGCFPFATATAQSAEDGNGESTVTAEGGDGEPMVSRKHLIDNKDNEVHRLFCGTPQVLQQGLLETTSLKHICIAGESNAGKSSLINHLLAKGSLAKASSVAGKTRSVDMMVVNDGVVVTDLPGLPSRDHQVAGMWEKAWRPLVFQYIRKCDNLLAMVYVHDVRWKVTSYVRDFLAEVEEHGLPVLLVLTKDDRIVTTLSDKDRATPQAERDAVHQQRQRLMKRIRRSMDFEGVHLHYSVENDRPTSRKARRRLLRYIESIVEAGSRNKTRALLDGIANSKPELHSSADKQLF